jgi:hypothetical protein
MLPSGIRKGIKTVFDPVVSSFFTTGRTKSGLAGMGCLNAVTAFWTDKNMISKKGCTAYKKFQYIDNNADPDKTPVYEKEFPPVPIIEKYISQFYTAYIFHEKQRTQKECRFQGSVCRRGGLIYGFVIP